MKFELEDGIWVSHFRLKDEYKFNPQQFQVLWNQHPEKRPEIKVFGKYHKIPRWQQVYGKNYKFSGILFEAQPIPYFFQNYLDYFSKLYKCSFNMVLVNWYENGKDYISMHSDDEKEIESDTPVITISFGTKRKFVVKSKDGDFKKEFFLENNDVLVMGGKNFQKKYKHGLPKQKKVTEKRISLTLRAFRE